MEPEPGKNYLIRIRNTAKFIVNEKRKAIMDDVSD